MNAGYPLRTAIAIAATGIPAAAAAQDTPYDLRDMVYARAGQAEAELQRRGYAYMGGEAGGDRKWSYWWSADRRQCVSIATVDGKFASIVSTPEADCRRSGGGRPGRPDRPGWDNRPGRPDWDGRPGGGSNWPGGRPISLGLVCFGEGQKPAAANRWGWQWNWDSNRYDFGNRTELTTRQFDASVMIQLWDGGGRIRLPRSLIPPIHSGGTARDGWWDLYDVDQDRGTIRATYRLNGPNKPRVTIDRRSGRIRIQGIYNYGFNGTCDTIDGRQHQRF
ncbi:hypothetical protein [Sphingomonas koreensis]